MRYANVTPEFVDSVWKRVERSASAFRVLEGASKESLEQALVKSFIILEFPFGIVRVSNMRFWDSCYVHGIFWSPSVWRQLGHLRIAIDHLFKNYNLKIIYCAVPAEQRSLRRLLTALGFKCVEHNVDYYGTQDSCVLSDIYAILSEGD